MNINAFSRRLVWWPAQCWFVAAVPQAPLDDFPHRPILDVTRRILVGAQLLAELALRDRICLSNHMTPVTSDQIGAHSNITTCHTEWRGPRQQPYAVI